MNADSGVCPDSEQLLKAVVEELTSSQPSEKRLNEDQVAANAVEQKAFVDNQKVQAAMDRASAANEKARA